MVGYFITFVFLVLSLLSGVLFYSGFDLNQLDVINNIKKIIGTNVDVSNKGLLENNKLTLQPGQNQIFFIKDKENIVIKANPDNEYYKNLEIKFTNYENLGDTQKTYNKGIDYSIFKCSDSNCTFENNNDFIIYKFQNMDNEQEKINEILIEGVRMQQVELSLLKKKSDGSVDYNYTMVYLIKTGDNNLKFPTVILKPGDELYIKIKIINDNFNI